jgi:membrane-associated phospholipid phosphatase
MTGARNGAAVRRRAAAAAGVAFAVVVVLAVAVRAGFGPLLRLDRAAAGAFYAGDGRGAGLDLLLHVLTAPGYTWFRVVALCPVVLWLVLRRAGWTAGWVLTAILLIGPLTSAAKEIVGRVRPDFARGGARLESLSYPSGHASGVATLVIVALLLAWPVLGAAARRLCSTVGVALVVVVGLSRMWLGVHFLSDVVGGWALGIAWALATALAFGALPGGRVALAARMPAGAR